MRMRPLFLSLVAGAVMAGVAYLTRPLLGPFLSAPLALVAYGLALWLTGGIEPEQVDLVRGFAGRKFGRRAA